MIAKKRIQAALKEENKIEIIIGKDFYVSSSKEFSLYADDRKVLNLRPLSELESNAYRTVLVPCENFVFVPGVDYEIVTRDNFYVPLDISSLAQTEAFEQAYRYDGQLGAIYGKTQTTFRVFSPFATRIVLNLEKSRGEWASYVMTPDRSTGVFSITVQGDFDGCRYTYSCTIFGTTSEVVDPYAFSVDANSRHGFVIDPEKIMAIPLHEDQLPVLDHPTKSVIYECNVRDMTSLTGLKHKGTYAALSQNGLKTNDGDPIGLDYLASLGVSHVQLMPVLDFQTINDYEPFSSYNWGYDPLMYFAPEGSYSLDPDDAYSRVVELRQLVSSLHQEGLRVTFDVVYNHVYSAIYNPLSVLVPNYYFRLNSNESMSNGSGCGNDIESRHYMARKLILDSLKHQVLFYGVDGFRFDLMGILDVDTMNQASSLVRGMKADSLMYGEGWDLWTALPCDQKASILNHAKTPTIGFFNDRFRDVVKGKTNASELWVRGYLLGDSNYVEGFKHVMTGSVQPMAFSPMFEDPAQSVNYVECHDNHTLFDKICSACPDDSEEEVFRRIKMIDMAILFATGIPFFHAGQEAGQSKHMQGNTYNAGDSLNGLDYALLHERSNLVGFFREACGFRKKFIDLVGDNFSHINDIISFDTLENNVLKMNYHLDDHADLVVIFNPTKSNIMYPFEHDAKLLFSMEGDVSKSDIYMHLGLIAGLSVGVYLVTDDYREGNN